MRVETCVKVYDSRLSNSVAHLQVMAIEWSSKRFRDCGDIFFWIYDRTCDLYRQHGCDGKREPAYVKCSWRGQYLDAAQCGVQIHRIRSVRQSDQIDRSGYQLNAHHALWRGGYRL